MSAATVRTKDVTFFSPSKTTRLPYGNLVDVDEHDMTKFDSDLNPVIVSQRLTERTYWMLIGFHTAMVYVGDHGVLMVDCGGLSAGPNETQAILKEIPRITGEPLRKKPITHLVYSHGHVDHVGNMGRIYNAMRDLGVNVKVIGSDRLRRYFRRYKTPLPPPTLVMPFGRQHFEFEGRTFTFVTPVVCGHSLADSYVIFPDKVMHTADHLRVSKRLPFLELSGCQNVRGFVETIRRLVGEAQAGNWLIGGCGHDNVTYPDDGQQYLDFLRHMSDIWFDVVTRPENNLGDFLYNPANPARPGAETLVRPYGGNNSECLPSKGNEYTWLRNWYDYISLKMWNNDNVLQGGKTFAQKWDEYEGFEDARRHLGVIHWDGFLNYDTLFHPEIRPDFDPIPPSVEIPPESEW